MSNTIWKWGCLSVFIVMTACTTKHQIEMKPMEVKPIHITIDVNVKVDRALDNFFDEIDQAEKKLD